MESQNIVNKGKSGFEGEDVGRGQDMKNLNFIILKIGSHWRISSSELYDLVYVLKSHAGTGMHE